ncbi:MAG: hypothetical protein QM652_00995 [Legionella sp.]|uniref:hypothetical protein n=1 Tax=Legionella sp. TaxID=459 RepID=UPI0039E5CDFC
MGWRLGAIGYALDTVIQIMAPQRGRTTNFARMLSGDKPWDVEYLEYLEEQKKPEEQLKPAQQLKPAEKKKAEEQKKNEYEATTSTIKPSHARPQSGTAESTLRQNEISPSVNNRYNRMIEEYKNYKQNEQKNLNLALKNLKFMKINFIWFFLIKRQQQFF